MTSLTSSDPVPPTTEAVAREGLTGLQVSQSLGVLGMLGYSELAAFSRLAADAALAPELAQRLELSRLAGAALRHLDQVGVRVGELGGDLQPVMEPFAGVLVEFDRRTVPGTWWERLLKGYVGYGVSDDFGRIVAHALEPRTRDLVVEALADAGHAKLVIDSLAAAGVADGTLASRLALWGRRLFGEALGVVQGVIAQHPEVACLLDDAVEGMPGSGDAQQRLFAALTADHSRRMERLGLTP